MGSKAISRDELLEKKDEIMEKYNSPYRKYNKPALLTKKEKKALGIGKDEGRATAKYIRIAPRKVKIVLDLIRGKKIDEAYAILKYTPKIASEVLLKLLKSAESNAVNNNDLDRDSLYVSECYANQGSILKRIQPRARGRAYRINKKTSHITLVVREQK
ncbi:MAG TPA: 50S ribosomal protein L22 [Clostridiaceae bacterium]|nr:50S ribosomal protein L22 [Clostridiaceae bacterium]